MKENFPTWGPETHKEVLSLEVCQQLAKEMFLKLDPTEVDQAKHYKEKPGKTFRDIADLLPGEISVRYDAHGVTRGTEVDQIAAALSILANHILKGDAGHLGGKGGYIPSYKSGGFLVVSDRDTGLMKRDADRKPIFRTIGTHDVTKKPIEGYEMAPFKLVVNKWFLPLIPELKRLFPNETILNVEELVAVLKKENEAL